MPKAGTYDLNRIENYRPLDNTVLNYFYKSFFIAVDAWSTDTWIKQYYLKPMPHNVLLKFPLILIMRF